MFFVCAFFFQAEDGIRDLVRSRGLGDVYKRQGVQFVVLFYWSVFVAFVGLGLNPHRHRRHQTPQPVSYTHLTLPTSDLV